LDQVYRRMKRILVLVVGLVFAIPAFSQKWSFRFQPGLVSTFNYFSDGMSRQFVKIKPNAGLGAAFGVGYRLASAYTVTLDYTVYPSNLNYGYRVGITPSTVVKGSRGRGFGMREAAIFLEKQSFIAATRRFHFSLLLRAGPSLNFLPPVNRDYYEEPTVSVFPPALFSPDSVIMVIHRTHVVGFRMGVGVTMRAHAQGRFAYSLLLDGFVSPRRFATERVFFSDGNTVVERRMSTNGSYISPRLRVCYYFNRKKEGLSSTESRAELRWSNKSGHKHDINLCFYGKENSTS